MNLEILPFHPRFGAGVLHLLAESMPLDPISEARFTQRVLLDANFRAEGALVAVWAGAVVGFCLGIKRHTPLENAPDDSARGYILLLAVRPEHRRRGIATRLLRAVEAYFVAQDCNLCQISPYAPGYFLPGVDVDAYREALEFLARRGYGEISRPLAMQTSLWPWNRPVGIEAKRSRLEAAGVIFKLYEGELTLPLLDFVSREFLGDWVRIARETMGLLLRGETSRGLICAVEGERVLGFAHHDGERFGPIGVANEARGRGLGQILMWETLRAQRERGLRASWFLWSDDKTADRLYRGAGFVEVRRFALLQKSLP